MFAKATRTARVWRRLGAVEHKVPEQSIMRMPEALMPKTDGGSASEVPNLTRRRATRNGVQVAGRVRAQNHHPGAAVLNRKAKLIKFYSDWIVTAELSNRKKIFDEGGRDDNVTKKNR